MEHFISTWGYLAIAVLTIAEAACVPFPSEVTIGVAGYLASQGRLDLPAVIALATVGETVGAYVGYSIGRFGGRPAVDRFGRYVLVTRKDVDRTQAWFERHGESSVFFGRILPVIRTFISIPAGLADMALLRFGTMTFLGSLVFMTALGTAGYELGGRWTELTHGFTVAGYVLVVVVVAAVAGTVALRVRDMRAERRAAASE
ncbi:MAG: DedA family protein [Actinomycetota bacterium]|nr:DedA family protein [Actinomycetota bacterium]